MAEQVITERLNAAFSASGLSQAELSRATGIDRASISLYLSGRYRPKADKLLRLAQVLHVAPEWLSGMEAEQTEGTVLLPIFEMTDGLRDSGGTLAVAEHCLQGDAGQYFALRVSGFAMYPRVLTGDLLLVRRGSRAADGSTVVLEQDGAVLVRVKQGRTLTAANPEYPPHALNEKSSIAGTAVMLLREL